MEAIDRRRILENLPLFSAFEGRELDRLVEMTTTRQLAAREELFHRGDEGAQLYGLLRGQLKVVGSNAEGKDVVFTFVDPGEVLGEIALLDAEARSATVVAVDESDLLVLHRRDLFAFLEKHPKAAIKLAQVLAARVRRLSESVEDAFFRGLPSRLAKKLLSLAKAYGRKTDDGVHIDMKLSQQALGEMVGTSRESVNKQLREWSQAGLVRAQRASITLLDAERLEDLAEQVVD